MGGRHSQESSPESSTPPSHHRTPPLTHHHNTSPSQHHTTPPVQHNTLLQSSQRHSVSNVSDYQHLHPTSSASHSTHRLRELRPLSLSRSASHTPEEQLMELNIALATLQQRLQAREESRGRSRSTHGSLPPNLPLLFFRQITTLQCPLCSKDVPSSEMQAHTAQCITRPRVTYNEDTITQEAGECSICLDDMSPGEEIARLPCLCIYHLKCLQQWFKVSQTCPEHPDLA